jgi:hypothetical protein
MQKISVNDIEKILNKACEIGNAEIKNKKAPIYTDSSISENYLVKLIKLSMIEFDFDEALLVHHGGHAFPDVTIKKSQIGIELKGSSSQRKFNGNSVVASTMQPNLKKIFILYWIGTPGEIGYRDYFECVATPVVTHSPRFQLDIDLKLSESMFGVEKSKVGTVAEVIFDEKGINSEKIINWMSNKAKLNGETPWWISGDDSLPTGSTGLVKSTNLAIYKRRAFMKSAFLAFPKILDKTSNNKYSGLFEWSITVKSIISSRDDFSAGGKVHILLPKFSSRPIEVPKVVQVALESLGSEDSIYLGELENPYGRKFKNAHEFLEFYRRNLPKYLTHIYSDVKKYDENNVKELGFSNLLAEMLIGKIKPSSLI